MPKHLVLCLALSLFTSFFKAQFNDSLNYYAGLTSTGTYNQTNLNQTFILNNGLKLGVKKDDVAVNANHKWLYGQQDDRIVNNDFTAVWELNLYKTFPHFNYWALFVYNRMYSLRINNQLQYGAGLAYNIIDHEKHILNISDGILYDYSDVQLSDTARDVYGTLRNSLRVQYKHQVQGLSLRAGFYLQNSLEYKSDYIVRAEASLSYKVLKWLSLTIQGNYNQMTRTKKETMFVTYGLAVEKYF